MPFPVLEPREETEMTYQRRNIDHDPVKPWNWASLVGRTDPVEIVSYPDPIEQTILVRLIIGDPTSIRYVPVSAIAAFSPDRHEWNLRPRLYYSDDPTAFIFKD